ncbi:hypothetical protein CLOM621_05407 [Clostridium sp. M62/1]|nr:hypothetical protein CLOM621_05407 [Clostridium sp. M62/1]
MRRRRKQSRGQRAQNGRRLIRVNREASGNKTEGIVKRHQKKKDGIQAASYRN